jgi:hypothetical protein
MMKICLCGYLIVAMGVSTISAFDVHIAPISYIDEQESSVASAPYLREELLFELHAYETGLALRFLAVSTPSINAPQSLLDAVKICRAEKLDYLIYGYVAKKDYTITAELKLFEYETRRVIQIFYAVDDREHYGRMVKDMAYKIMAYLNEAMHLEVLEPEVTYTSISFPVSLGYWSPINKNWTDILLGVFVLAGGVQLTPNDHLFTAGGFPFFVSLHFDLVYRFGIGNPNAYTAYNNGISFISPIRLNMRINGQQQVYLGIGLLYRLDILGIMPRYRDDLETTAFSALGLMGSAGYRFQVTDRISLFFDNQFEAVFYDFSIIDYSFCMGVDILWRKKEVNRTW